MSDWLTFQDEVYKSAEVVAKIERSARERTKTQPELLSLIETIPHYGAVSAAPLPPDDLPYSAQLFHHLRQANQLCTEFETEPTLADSAAVRVPVLGAIWRRIRGEAHNLVLFYVNRLAAEQNQLTAQLIGTVNELTRQNIDLQRKVSRLEEKLADLDGVEHRGKG